MTPAVFLDRDGTLIADPGHLRRLSDLHWFPWSLDAIRLLNRAGFLVIVITNQGGIGLGFYEDEFVHLVHREMTKQLDAAGASIDAWYYCPHHPKAISEALRVNCECRKPRPGMIRQAQADFPIDLAASFVVGDKVGDVGLGAAIGVPSVLVRTGHGQEELDRRGGAMPGAAHVADDVMAAVAWILAASGHPREAVR